MAKRTQTDERKDKTFFEEAEELMKRLEYDYEFECEAGSLKNCQEWRRLKIIMGVKI